MKSFLQREYRELKASPPGRRFQELHRRRMEKRKYRQPWLAIVGLPVLLFGIFLLFVPGPGVIFVVVGLALFAQESPFVARALDAAELRLLCWFHRRNGRPQFGSDRNGEKHSEKQPMEACGQDFTNGGD